MVLALLLFDRANEHGRVDSPRALLSTALRRPVGAPGDEARHPARRGCSSPHSKFCKLGCLRDFAIFSRVYQRGITEINRV
jgi:hypothetical protein